LPVETEKMFSMRCPACGKLEYYRLRRFAVGKGMSVNCSCESVKININSRNFSEYQIQVACVFCGGFHVYNFSGKQLWSSGETIILSCDDTGLELGRIGPVETIMKTASDQEDELEFLVDEYGKDGFFYNNRIMYEVLQCLHDIAERGTLYCQCGNRRIEVDIFPDRLELQCSACGSVNIIYAETDDDLQVIQQIEEIELTRNGFDCLDSLARTGKKKKKPGTRRNNKT